MTAEEPMQELQKLPPKLEVETFDLLHAKWIPIIGIAVKTIEDGSEFAEIED